MLFKIHTHHIAHGEERAGDTLIYRFSFNSISLLLRFIHTFSHPLTHLHVIKSIHIRRSKYVKEWELPRIFFSFFFAFSHLGLCDAAHSIGSNANALVLSSCDTRTRTFHFCFSYTYYTATYSCPFHDAHPDWNEWRGLTYSP